MSNSSRRKSKHGPRLKNVGQFVVHPITLIRVLKDLSLSARRILDTLEIEHCRHGGRDNGELPCTYSDFERYIQRKTIRPALNELIAAGLIEVTRIGRRAYADLPRTCSLYRVTYLPTFRDGEWAEPTHDWKNKKPVAIPPLDQWQNHHLKRKKPGENPPLLPT